MNNNLYNFLIEAKKQTYANENIEKVNSSRRNIRPVDVQVKS